MKWMRGYGTRLVWNSVMSTFSAPSKRSEAVSEAVATLAAADAVIAVTPVFNGAYSGLFKLLLDVLDEGTLRGVPVLLAATGGTARHSLAIDQTMVPLFYYLRARPTTSPVFAATDDWADPRALDARRQPRSLHERRTRR